MFDVLGKTVSSSSLNDGNTRISLVLLFEVELEFAVILEWLLWDDSTFVLAHVLFSDLTSITYDDYWYSLEGGLFLDAADSHIDDVGGWVRGHWRCSDDNDEVRGVNFSWLIH